MGLKAKIEAIIYAAEEPITLEQISVLVRDIVIAEQAAEAAKAAEVSTEEQVLTGTQFEGPTSAMAGELGGNTLADTDVPENTSDDASMSEELQPTPDSEDATVGQPTAEPLEAEAERPSDAEASVHAPEPTRTKRKKSDAPKRELSEDAKVRAHIRAIIEELISDYDREERGMEIRQIAGGYRMGTKPEHHDVVRAFAKSLKPTVRLSLAALETLAVIAYKQPVTVPEISEIRGVEASGVIGTLLDRKLITTSGRKQVIGRPILYKTSKEFLLRFGLNEIAELPSMEEFEKLASDGQADLFSAPGSEPAPQPDSEATLETGESTTSDLSENEQPASETATIAQQAEGSVPDAKPAKAEDEESVDAAGSDS